MYVYIYLILFDSAAFLSDPDPGEGLGREPLAPLRPLEGQHHQGLAPALLNHQTTQLLDRYINDMIDIKANGKDIMADRDRI